jgi:predicted phage tail protein
MGINRAAKGIVLVPCLLLGAAFLAASAWGEADANRTLALTLGLSLMAGGLLAQFLPEPPPEQQTQASAKGDPD